jgi:hypothetical protein
MVGLYIYLMAYTTKTKVRLVICPYGLHSHVVMGWHLRLQTESLVLKLFDYEISKRAIIHMDFVEHFFKYYNLKRIASIKTTNVIMILFKFKNRI